MGVAALQGLSSAWLDVRLLAGIVVDPDRAVDTALAEARPGDVGGVAIYVHEAPRSTLDQVIAAHPRTWVVVYDHRDDPRFTRGLDAGLGPAVVIGPDRLHRAGDPVGTPLGDRQ